MEMWTEVRRRVLTGELSKRAACREYGLNWRTLEKMLSHAEPPGYRRKAKREQPVLGPHLAWIHEVLEQDKQAPKKQRHTAQRIFDRLKAEKGCSGGVTIVKEAVREWKDATKEVFVPLSHPPGEAQVDFGFASVDLAGERQQVALIVMSLPYSAPCTSRRSRGSAPRHSSRATTARSGSSVACRGRSATTTARSPWPGSPAAASGR